MDQGTELVTCGIGCPMQGHSREDSSVTQTHSGSPADILWLQEDVKDGKSQAVDGCLEAGIEGRLEEPAPSSQPPLRAS